MGKILIKNGTVVTLGDENKILKNASVVINNDKVEKIIPAGESIVGDFEQIIDAKNKLVMPGFICAHMHYYSSFARGLGKANPSKNFPEVLENLWWRLDKKLSLDDTYYSAMVANVDAIKHGTTTLIDHHASPNAVIGSLNKLAQATKDCGLRTSLCYELSDRDGKKISDEGIKENIDFIERTQKEKDDSLHALFGMHASFTIEEDTMKKAAELALSKNAGFHIHCAEDISDQEVTQKKFGKRVVERLNHYGMLGKNTILVHCVHVNDKERDLIKNSDTIVVHNPQSNMNNAVGVMDLLDFSKRGILVGLGTDAMTVNMREELRACMWIHKLTNKNPSVGFMETVNTLTVNNRKIAKRFWPNMGLGEIKVGGKADIILIDYLTPTEFSENTFLGHLVFGIPHAIVDTTIANGKVLMKNKVLTNLDEEAIYKKSEELSKALWNRF